jgi:hypothetical protein
MRRNTRTAANIYRKHYGPIPKDESGRSYEVHHVDGDHQNNSIENLKLVTILEHYKIHESQGDWGACWLIAKRLNLDGKTISEIARQSSLKRLADGTHNFIGLNERRVKNGTHNLLGGEITRKNNKIRMENGTHNMLDQSGSKNLNYDHTIYIFKHRISGDIVNMTQYDFVKKYELNKGNVNSMIKGNVPSVKNWICLGHESN